MIATSIPGRFKDFSLVEAIETNPNSYPASCPMGKAGGRGGGAWLDTGGLKNSSEFKNK
jgi:hypothetical protein